jgi:exosortase
VRLLAEKRSVTAAKTITLDDINPNARIRYLILGCWIVLSSLLFSHAIAALVRMSLSNADASHLVVIPFISAWVLFIERQRIFVNLSYNITLGGSLLFGAVCVGLATNLAGNASSWGLELSGYILSLTLFWVAGFALLFGKAASTAASFPFFFLLLMIPPPNFLLGRLIYLLQAGSAWTTGALFDLFGVPALREGFVFHLVHANIEIAKECSGIRSSMALLILGLLVAHFRLKSFWKKALFLVCGIFMMILKNGIRIATLTLLAMYVDPSFLFGKLHHQGGVVFFILGLLLLWPILLLLERNQSEKTSPPASMPIG